MLETQLQYPFRRTIKLDFEETFKAKETDLVLRKASGDPDNRRRGRKETEALRRGKAPSAKLRLSVPRRASEEAAASHERNRKKGKEALNGSPYWLANHWTLKDICGISVVADREPE